MRIRSEAGCVNEHDIIKLRTLKSFHADINVMGVTMTRKMVKVPIKDEMLFADLITGTLYNPQTKKCNSARIFLEKVYKA
jgi:hypothetical protein